MPADKSRTAIVRLYGGNCFSARYVRTPFCLCVLVYLRHESNGSHQTKGKRTIVKIYNNIEKYNFL